jgi:hypothetical protein
MQSREDFLLLAYVSLLLEDDVRSGQGASRRGKQIEPANSDEMTPPNRT